MPNLEPSARIAGALFGLAAGDALGTTLEFRRPGTFDPIEDMVGGGPFRLQPGEWTDDTSMAMCMAESIVECQGFDPVDQLDRYLRWYKDGHWSVKDRCFDIGHTTREGLIRFHGTRDPESGSKDPNAAGNGSLMRLAPTPAAFWRDPPRAIAYAAQSSKATHGAPECVDACRYFAGLLVGAIQGRDKESLLSERFAPYPRAWEQPLSPKVDAITAGSFKEKQPPEIRGRGYVIDTLEAALWAFYNTDNFRDGALKVVNLGDDADTTGAVYGQIAGAFYGFEGIPATWRDKIAMKDQIQAILDRLIAFSETITP